jgi:hypothetical protein
MRNAHRALNDCHEGRTIGQKPTSGNSKTAGRTGMDVGGRFNILTGSKLSGPLGGLASRAIPA